MSKNPETSDDIAKLSKKSKLTAEINAARIDNVLDIVGKLGDQLVELANTQNASDIRISNLESSLSLNLENSLSLLAEVGANVQNLSNRQDLFQNQNAEQLVRARAGRYAGMQSLPAPKPHAKLLSLAEQEAILAKSAAPQNWDIYKACLDTGTESYEDLPEVSCSTERHPQANLFKTFLESYLRGNVLDIGCGPQPIPVYLEGYPLEAITGCDPISSQDDHPFQFVSGYGEMLPWDDNSFDVVVSATVLDHYFLLDKGLEEIFRVLKPGGHFVSWITHFNDAPPYDPNTLGGLPYDHEHMYHINLEWFAPLMDKIGFREAEIVEMLLPFRYLFMSHVKPA